MPDFSKELQQTVQEAFETRSALKIVGGNSKSFYGRDCDGTELRVSDHSGIVNYEPTELVISALAGTPTSEIEALLAENHQMLGFEPPRFADDSTLGGTVACGLSGPRRPFAGAVRDFVLGCRILNGKGELLSFGGEVMKNVAGYDVSRLMAGSLGTLGVLLEISLKILPRPPSEMTLAYEMDDDKAIETMNEWCTRSLLLSALCYDGQRVHMRLSGNKSVLLSTARKMGGERIPNSEQYWRDVRDQNLVFFQNNEILWRFSLSPATPFPLLSGQWFSDWAGAQRWLKSDEQPDSIFRSAAGHGGHALLFRGDDGGSERFQPLPQKLWKLHKSVKQAFDPAGILNPGRMYKDL